MLVTLLRNSLCTYPAPVCQRRPVRFGLVAFTLALCAGMGMANDKPNPSECPSRTATTGQTCGKLWCDYYACASKQGHSLCKPVARAAIRVCTVAQDPTFKFSAPIQPSTISPFGSAPK